MLNNGKKVILSVALVLCLALVVAAAFGIVDRMYSPDEEDFDGPVDLGEVMNAIYVDGVLCYPKPGVRNYLIMGIDKYGESGSDGVGQVDFLMVLSFDSNTEKYTMVSINRDTMVVVDESDGFGGHRMVYKQIALSHDYRGTEGVTNNEKCENTARAASRVLCEMKFDGYMSMTMDAIAKMVDKFGGIDILVEDDLTSVDARLVKGETVKLDGELAVKFVRARGGLEDSSNSARMKRQEAFLSAFFEKITQSNLDETLMLEIYEEIQPYVCNDSGESGYEDLFYKLSKYELSESITLKGESAIGKGGYVEFSVDESHIKEVMVDVFYDKVQK